MIEVSVIIPAYNQAQFLGPAIRSVLEQTYQSYEIIVVDDGSTDDTREVVSGFADPRIRYVYQANQGLSAARNTGLRNSDAPLVTFLDSDDLFLPDKLASLVAVLESNPDVGFVAGQAIWIDVTGRRVAKMSDAETHPNGSMLLLGNPFHVGSVLLHRHWLERVGLFDERLRACEDWDLWLRLARAGCQMRSVEYPVSLYRAHGDQMTQSAERMRTAALAVLDKVFSAPDLADDWCQLEGKAYAGVHLRAAARGYRVGLVEQAQCDLTDAVLKDPTLEDDAGSSLTQCLAGWAFDPATSDPVRYLETVYDNLPSSLAALNRRKRQELASVYMKYAFDHLHRGDLPAAGDAAFLAVYYWPRWITNRGLISIVLRSIVSKARLLFLARLPVHRSV